jgi:uncharacterized membrane protein YphA (DoxX/SURF4 family)
MDASTTAGPLSRSLEMPRWKSVVGHVAAALIALIFISSGVWKATDPFAWARNLEEFLVPTSVSLPFTVLLAIGETFGGVLILVPRFRRWGAAITSFLLVCFMGYIGLHYSALLGKDCTCFPIVKRTVGPMLFLGDGAMLVGALLAGWWAAPVRGLRGAAVVLGAVAVFAGVSYGSALAHLSGTKAPDSIIVDGKPFSLQNGRFFLFFYDPECGECDAAARSMAKLKWKSDVTIVGIPTHDPQFAPSFLHDTGLKAVTSAQITELKKIFPFGDPPFGVAIERGREIGPVSHYHGTEPADSLRKLGYIE